MKYSWKLLKTDDWSHNPAIKSGHQRDLGKIRKRGGGCGLVIEGLCWCCVQVQTLILTIYSAQWWLASSVHVLVPSSFKCRRNKPKYSGRIFQFGILFTFYILFSNANCVSSTCNNCCYHSNIHLIYISTATHLLHSTHNITNWKYPCTPVIKLNIDKENVWNEILVWHQRRMLPAIRWPCSIFIRPISTGLQADTGQTRPGHFRVSQL